MGKTISQINDRIAELKNAKQSFTLAKQKLGENCRENYIDSWNCNLAIELIDKELQYLEKHEWE